MTWALFVTLPNPDQILDRHWKYRGDVSGLVLVSIPVTKSLQDSHTFRYSFYLRLFS